MKVQNEIHQEALNDMDRLCQRIIKLNKYTSDERISNCKADIKIFDFDIELCNYQVIIFM